MTGVYLTAYFGLSNMIKALLKRGNDPDLKNSNSRTALSYAAGNGREAVVKLLLEQGAEKP